MTAQPLSDLDIRRRKARYRAWHRGMRETDLVFGNFADREIDRMPPEDLAVFEALLDESDADLLAWITGKELPPSSHDTPLFARIRESYRPRD